jgi:putative nucleotidyltransferase with HDIG domain
MEKILRQRSIGTKILGIILLATFLITATLGYLSFDFSRRRLATMLGESIRGIAGTTANFIRAEDVLLILKNSGKIRERYMAAKDLTYSHVYEKTAEAEEANDDVLHQAILSYSKYADILANIKLMNKIDSPINVYVRNGNRLKLILTSDSVLLTGAEYVMRPEAREAFMRGSPQSTGIYKDKDGTWISSYAPIPRLLPGIEEALIEINLKIDSYLHRLHQELWIIVLGCFVGFFITGVVSYQLVTRLISTIKRLDELATELEQEKYDIPIEVRSKDEIGHLAETFEKLRVSIRRKIYELRLSLLREKKAHLESIIALTNAVELRDPYTRHHLFRVDKYALLIAKAMRLPRNLLETLRYSCYLHDVGKIGVELTLLQKVKLTKDDFEEVKKHAEKGAQIVQGIQFLQEVKDVILCHQERYDGKGYPKGLKGEEIPLLARIVSVADAFDAMTTDRPYKPKVSFREAMDTVEREAGAQFDPEACKAFLKYRPGIEGIAKKHFEGFAA